MTDTLQNNYFEKKQAKEAALEKETRTRQLKRGVKWLFILVTLTGLGYSAFSALNRPTGPKPGEFFAAQSRDHIAVGASHSEYNSNPPTSGWHYAVPAQSGIYDTVFPDEQLLHNLEHGHIWIAYRPDLPKDQIEALADIAKSYSSKIIMVPRPNNPAPIALAAWEYLLKLDSFNEQQVKDFINAYRGKGPEQIPDFGFKDFRDKTTPIPGAPMI